MINFSRNDDLVEFQKEFKLAIDTLPAPKENGDKKEEKWKTKKVYEKILYKKWNFVGEINFPTKK